MDEVDQKTNELVEEEADEDENEGGDSALQIRPTEIEDRNLVLRIRRLFLCYIKSC